MAQQGKNNAKMYDTTTMLAAGLNPNTKQKILPPDLSLKESIKNNIRLIDEAAAIKRYKWSGLPYGLNADLIEKVLYRYGQGALFYMEADEKFYFLPYALSAIEGTSGIDCYGRYTGITPVPYGGGTNSDGKKEPWIQGLQFKPQYDLPIFQLSYDEVIKRCVLLKDYTNPMSQVLIPRQVLQDKIIDIESECFPMMRTALKNSTGIDGVRVGDQTEAANVEFASKAIDIAALTGQKFVPIVGKIDFQELTTGNVAKAEEFLLAMQSIDNFRLGQYGIGEGSVFTKKAHMLQSEQDMNAGNVGLTYNDGLELRQEMCNIGNLLFGLNMWCEAAETIAGIDKNMDGEISDELDGQEPVDNGGMTDDE